MSAAVQILLVDDEPQLTRALRPALMAAGYEVQTAESGAAAIAHLASEVCDIVILDLGLPDMDGKEVIQRIREWAEMPIVVLSARNLETEKIAALDAGADDFVNKPFSVGELLARVRAGLRGRDRRFASQARVRSGDLEVNFATRTAKLQGEDLHLTPREYDLIRTMARYAGRVVTHNQLIAAVWGGQARVDAQFVRVLVGQVRQKIEEHPASPRILLTEPGVGYRLVIDEDGHDQSQ
jgi:two-component system KDP operon response regulator KdpE